MNIHSFSFNLFQVHTVVAWQKAPDCIVVDPGFYIEDEKAEFFAFLSSEKLRPSAILLTHAHIDHIYGVIPILNAFGRIPVYMDDKEMANIGYAAEAAGKFGMRAPSCSFATTPVYDGGTIEHAGMRFEVISTPGHAPGAVCYLERDEKLMFTGDTLFAGTIGRSDLRFGEYDRLIESVMEKLIILPGDITIIPGHGRESTIGWERTHNPFLEPFNEPEEEIDPDAPPIIIHR